MLKNIKRLIRIFIPSWKRKVYLKVSGEFKQEHGSFYVKDSFYKELSIGYKGTSYNTIHHWHYPHEGFKIKQLKIKRIK